MLAFGQMVYPYGVGDYPGSPGVMHLVRRHYQGTDVRCCLEEQTSSRQLADKELIVFNIPKRSETDLGEIMSKICMTDSLMIE